MANVIQHLATAPATGYTVFEDNQVLTKEPLNRLVDYLDDQERLTRVSLLGVGIFCGLRLSAGAAGVVLTRGVAVTTDGDLLRVPQDLTYTRFRRYGTDAPKYDPFYSGANMRPVFELVGDEVNTAAKLDTFSHDGKKVTDMIGVLLMESFQKDADLCTGGDCDNKGKDALGNVKLLLMAPGDVAALREKLSTLSAASGKIPPTYAKRVLLNATIDSAAKLAAVYRAAATDTRGRLLDTLKQVLGVSGVFFPEVFPKDPLADWTAKLNTAVPDSAAEQYYDHLKNVVDACNAFGALVGGDTTVCCPPQPAFPKHVLLGAVGTAPLDLDADRTGSYPSPLVRASRQTVARARFMLRRIDTLIMGFAPIPQVLPVTITPSRTDDRPLDERAIPAYYGPAPAASWPIHRAWSYELEHRGLAEFNYSASKAVFTPKGAAGEPLSASISAATFMRIEGHVGGGVLGVMKTISGTITGSNLPFIVRAVLLHTDRTKIAVKPGIRYNDLHRIHQLFRHDLARQIDDLKAQTAKYSKDVTEAVQNKVFDNTVLGDTVSISGKAKEASDVVNVAATNASKKLDMKYSEYKAQTWMPDVDTSVAQSASLRMTLGDVTKSELSWPVDTLYSTWRPHWNEWLDELIEWKDQEEDDKLLFKNFIAQHPAAEHLGGVPRGGTFVLLYNDGGTVVGDVTLPYYWQEIAEPEPEPKPLPQPAPNPFKDKHWVVLKPWEVRWKLDLDKFKLQEMDPLKKYTLEFSTIYTQAIKDSAQIFSQLGNQVAVPGTKPRAPSLIDQRLDIAVKDVASKSDRVDSIRRVLLDPALDAQKRTEFEDQLKTADKELGTAIEETSKIITAGNVDIKTDAPTAAVVVSDAFAKLNPTTARSTANAIRTQADATGVKPEVKTMMNGVLRGRGF